LRDDLEAVYDMEAMQRKQQSSNLAWIDLEMTGLDVERDVILQAALIVTNQELESLEEASFDVWQPEPCLATMSPFVRDMHEKNGLLKRSKESRFECHEVERRLLERISGWCAFPAMLCGNSIGQDRRFINRYMPGLAGYLHYRMVDVSSLKVLMHLWYGQAGEYRKPEAGAHDALFDVRQSIEELKYYRSRFLVKP
jgi:oligoribonuclease